MTQIVPYEDMDKMAQAIVSSGLFNVKKKDEALALMLIAQAEGSHPAIAARDYHIIQGRPALKADAVLARFQSAGGSVKWEEYTDERVTGIFSHPAGGSVPVTWTYAMAERIGLTKKDNWRNYPRAMLRSRCISEGVRTVFPGVVSGIYTDEETEDFKPVQKAPTVQEPKNMGAAEIVIEEPVTEYQLFLPDGSVYANCNDWHDYIDRYADMLAAIQNSTKLKTDEKKQKSKDWEAANAEAVKRMDAVTRTRLIAAKQGVDTFEDLEDAIE